MPTKMILLGSSGPEYSPRFFLVNRESNYWNESKQEWTTDYKAKTLWANSDEAIQRQYELMVEQVPGTLHQFTAPIIIKVKSEQPIDVATLQRWLNKAIEVYIDTSHGTGPGDSMVMFTLDWDEIEENENE